MTRLSHLHNVFDHVHPAVTGAVLSMALPFDHLTNVFWGVLGSLSSYAAVRCAGAVVRWLQKKLQKPSA